MTEGLTDADVVFGFGRTGVLNDYDFHVGRAPVLEVVKRTLGCEHDVAGVLVETSWLPFPSTTTHAATPLVSMLISHALGCQCGSRIPPGCR